LIIFWVSLATGIKWRPTPKIGLPFELEPMKFEALFRAY